MLLRGVKFGDYHTVEDWGLVLNSKNLTLPVPKIVYIPIEGRDGDLDLSEALTGEVKYENRIASFTFLLTDGTYSDREELISEITRVIHGKRLSIIIDDEPDRYLDGRCALVDVSNTKAYGVIVIECNCNPWKYARSETTLTITATSSNTEVILTNFGGKSLIPDIMVSGDITLIIDDSTHVLSTGDYKITDLILKSGKTTVKVKGFGTITFKYREAIL